MEFPVGLLKRLRNALDGFHDFKALQKIHIHAAGIADEAQNGDLLAFGNVYVKIHAFQPINKMLSLFGGGSVLQNSNHNLISFKIKSAATRCDPVAALENTF